MCQGILYPISKVYHIQSKSGSLCLLSTTKVALLFDKSAVDGAIVILNLNIFLFQNILNQIFGYHTSLKYKNWLVLQQIQTTYTKSKKIHYKLLVLVREVIRWPETRLTYRNNPYTVVKNALENIMEDRIPFSIAASCMP